VCAALAFLVTGQDADTVRRLAASGRAVPVRRCWARVVHRDVKPSNIFMTWDAAAPPYPTLLLSDFGCAVARVDVAEPALPVGDVEFAPPEFPAYSDKGDVWALAMSVVCVGWMRQGPPPGSPLGDWASKALNVVLRMCLRGEEGERLGPCEAPREVWRGWRIWMEGRDACDSGNALPGWALGG
jgi:serine/threonine protein kinase